jgi:TPR repeat protein
LPWFASNALASSERDFYNRLSKEEIGIIASEAASGNVDAKYFFANYLGSVNPTGSAESQTLTAEAARAGHPSAEFDLCMTESLVQDKPPSMTSCMRAALDGNPNAQAWMGLALSLGMFGLKEDASAALDWYRMAAFQGDTIALSTVGDRYSSGTGVQKDDALAIHYWERAASQDSTPALRQLGRAYALGWGVPVDLEKAKFYFTRASDFGDGLSQYCLGLLYRAAGNFQSAYVMQTLALKTVEAGETRDGVVKERIELQSMLLPEQVRKSAKIAKSWRKKIPKPAPFIGGTDSIKRLQKELNERGFGAGDEDGIAGSATINAYRQYADVLHIPNAPFDQPTIYYVAFRLNLYGKVQPSQPDIPAPVVASREVPTQPSSRASDKQPEKSDVVSTGSGVCGRPQGTRRHERSRREGVQFNWGSSISKATRSQPRP